MGSVTRMPLSGSPADERGFSLIEVLVAISILTAGLLPLVAVFGTAVHQMRASTPMLIAREKAREAIESVHAARDTGAASWATIQNVADGGVFNNDPQAIREAGADALVNTADDGEDQLGEGLFTREIDILPLLIDGTATVNPNLRELRVIVRYRVGTYWHTYTMVTYISSYS